MHAARDSEASTPSVASSAAPATSTRSPLKNRARREATFGVESTKLLSSLDNRLVDTLKGEDIRFIDVVWLRSVLGRPGYRVQRLQDLPSEALLSPEAAVALIRRATRAVGVLSYGWLSDTTPDPAGARLGVLLQCLNEHDHIEALFWDFMSLPQKGGGVDRTSDEVAAFKRALNVMVRAPMPRLSTGPTGST